MKGDFTRGFNPDRKRGRDYRRVLAQEGRLLLDSDVNALVDASDRIMRRMAEDFGCTKGSPDLGFLITPGRLLALFRTLDQVSVTAGAPELYRDFQHKLLDRYPSLYLGNSSGAPASVAIELRSPTAGDVVVWVRSEANTTFDVTGAGQVVINNPSFEAKTITPPANTGSLEITLDDGEEIWIALIESFEPAATQPHLWSAGGSFYVDGLLVDQAEDGRFADLHFDPFTDVPNDPGAGFSIADLTLNGNPLQPQDRVVVYLEAWERHLTAVEDRGILEIALGGALDTTTRSRALGQVKLAATDALLGPDEIRDAVCHPLALDGTLDVTTVQVAAPDPCDIPLQGGYRGLDNRLYRFEVHTGGDLGACLLKWSRNNGSELYRASDVTLQGNTISELIFAADTPLKAGDLVEVLNEYIDLTDLSPAVVDSVGGTFTPAERRSGRLVRLHDAAAQQPGAGKVFTLSEPDDDQVPVFLGTPPDPPFGNPPGPPPKVRLWHGLIDPDGVADPWVEEAEDGIEVSLTGTFRSGDWWQYEARARGANDNGPFQTSPHGPERLFAPLALLEVPPQPQNNPLVLLAWLDERFPSLCGITADDVSFDGTRVDAEEFDTVQEALEELFEREVDGGCCGHTLDPDENGDDSQQILDLLAAEVGDLHICLKPGIYHFPTTVPVAGRRLTLHGCPDATLVAATAPNPVFDVGQGGKLILERLSLFAPAGQAPDELVAVAQGASGLTAEAVAFLIASPAAAQTAVRLQGAPAQAPVKEGSALVVDTGFAGAPSLAFHSCVFVAGWAVIGATAESLTLHDSACYCTEGGISSGGIGRVDIARTAIVVGVDLGPSNAWTALDVDAQGSALVEAVAAAPAVPGGTAALAIGALAGGAVLGSVLHANLCVAASQASAMVFQGNRHTGNIVGLTFDETDRVRIDGEDVEVVGGDASVGIQIATSSNATSIESSRIEAGAVGVLLGADLDTSLDNQLQARKILARVAGNTIRVIYRAGVQLGYYDASGIIGVARVEIHDNDIVTAEGVAIVARGEAFFPDVPADLTFLPGGLSLIRVSDNRTSGPNGIWATGTGIEIESNRILLDSPSTAQFGVLVDAAPTAVVEGNLVEDLGAKLGKDATGYWVRDGFAARLAGNVCRTSPKVVAVRVSNHPHLRLVGNDLGVGPCSLTQVNRLEARGNTTSSSFSVFVARDGVVRDNQVGVDESTFLAITTARGNWQIEDNRVRGALRLIPATTRGFLVYPIGPGNLGAYLPFNHVAATSFHMMTGDAADDPGSIFGRYGEAAAASPFLSRAGGPESAMSYAASNRSWASAWTDLLLNDLEAVYKVPLGELGIGNLGDLTWLLSNEVAYNAQVVGNWCDVLQVGHEDPKLPRPSANTLVQVAVNRADEALIVRQYNEILVCDNAAESYPSWIPTSPVVVTHNMEF